MKRSLVTTIALAVALLAAGCVSGAAARSGSAGTRGGHLLIVGGGPIPEAIVRRFVELAGGDGRARILVIPSASGDPDAGTEITGDFRKLGAQAQRWLPDRTAADGAESARRLAGVTGVWFGGGDQSRLTKVVKGTRLEREIREVYSRGGVVGGTSAGAAVMSDPMITGDERRPGGERPPKDREDPLGAYTTVERGNVVTAPGFGLLPGVIVDQHFVRRRRHNRLLSLVLENPSLVGVGIDESTALEVDPDGPWRVLGVNAIVVYDARRAALGSRGATLGGSGIRLSVLPAGSRYDPASGRATLPS